VLEANAGIIEKLRASGHLAHDPIKYSHQYPHCWRCKSPIIFRATHQWFLKIDHNGLRQTLLKSIDQDVTWIPSSGRERISAMVAQRPDWCLSRQRYWGVPIPAVVCAACHEHALDSRVIRKLASHAAAAGTDAWFTMDVKEFLPEALRCPKCGKDVFEKIDGYP